MWLIAGLGNPGNYYKNTRHNIGFLVLDALAAKRNISWKKQRYPAVTAKYTLNDEDIFLIKPQSYMNRSGEIVNFVVQKWCVPTTSLIVVHDDLDLSFERIKLKKMGGAGGHKGIGSIIEELDADTFLRVKMGIGRPDDPAEATEEYVLGLFTAEQAESLPAFLARGVEAVEGIIYDGPEKAMNRFNKKEKKKVEIEKKEGNDSANGLNIE